MMRRPVNAKLPLNLKRLLDLKALMGLKILMDATDHPVVERGKLVRATYSNGEAVARKEVPADGAVHRLEWNVSVDASSWIAVRQFPQLHSNPVNVIVNGKPIRASKKSARWCIKMTELLWKNRERKIAEGERDEAGKAFDHAIDTFKKIESESQ